MMNGIMVRPAEVMAESNRWRRCHFTKTQGIKLGSLVTGQVIAKQVMREDTPTRKHTRLRTTDHIVPLKASRLNCLYPRTSSLFPALAQTHTHMPGW